MQIYAENISEERRSRLHTGGTTLKSRGNESYFSSHCFVVLSTVIARCQDCSREYCTVLYRTVLYRTVLYCTVPYLTVLHHTVLYCTVVYCTVLYRTVLYCTLLYCTVLYCTLLYCIVLFVFTVELSISSTLCRPPRCWINIGFWNSLSRMWV